MALRCDVSLLLLVALLMVANAQDTDRSLVIKKRPAPPLPPKSTPPKIPPRKSPPPKAPPKCEKKCVHYDDHFCVHRELECQQKACVIFEKGKCRHYAEKCVEYKRICESEACVEKSRECIRYKSVCKWYDLDEHKEPKCQKEEKECFKYNLKCVKRDCFDYQLVCSSTEKECISFDFSCVKEECVYANLVCKKVDKVCLKKAEVCPEPPKRKYSSPSASHRPSPSFNDRRFSEIG